MLNSHIEGIQQVELGVIDTEISKKFLIDFGLNRSGHHTFSTLNNSTITLKKTPYPTVNSITWCIDKNINLEQFYKLHKDSFISTNATITDEFIECIDPVGLKLLFTKNSKKQIQRKGQSINSWNNIKRTDQPVTKVNYIHPVEIGHIVIETFDINACEDFYKSFGFVVSDRLIGRGVFLRCNISGGHHDLFLVDAKKVKLNHIAFTMTDVYELLEGGRSMEDKGWKTMQGPGRHNISSAFFWYFDSPLGLMFEYSSNEDYLTDKWIPREITMEKNLLSKESFISRV